MIYIRNYHAKAGGQSGVQLRSAYNVLGDNHLGEFVRTPRFTWHELPKPGSDAGNGHENGQIGKSSLLNVFCHNHLDAVLRFLNACSAKPTFFALPSRNAGENGIGSGRKTVHNERGVLKTSVTLRPSP